MKSSNPIIPKENKLMDEIIISVFYDIDNFCKELKIFFEHSLLPCDENPTSFEPPSALSLSEIMTICVLFHLSGYQTFKWYYTKFIQKDCRKFFPRLVSYNRFVELMPYGHHAAGTVCTGNRSQIPLYWHKLCGFYNVGCV